jgi:hypothetical protein
MGRVKNSEFRIQNAEFVIPFVGFGHEDTKHETKIPWKGLCVLCDLCVGVFFK